MYLRDLKRLIFISLLINNALHKFTTGLLCNKRGGGHSLNGLDYFQVIMSKIES